MKVFFTSILTIACGVILVLGNLHWNNKTTILSNAENAKPTIESAVEEETKETTTLDSETIEEALMFAQNWPDEALIQLEDSLNNNIPFHILIVGSTVLGTGPSSWPELVKQGLYDTYGEEVITVSTEIYAGTSKEFLDEDMDKELADMEADLIIWEPFTLKDNGVVVIEDSIVNIQEIIEGVKEVKDETTFILQPPHPITGSKWYPIQVRELEEFATENEIPYLNHWEAWPEKSNEYLTAERDQPNEQGHQVWANYILEKLIAK